jgi:hypothetical protein
MPGVEIAGIGKIARGVALVGHVNLTLFRNSEQKTAAPMGRTSILASKALVCCQIHSHDHDILSLDTLRYLSNNTLSIIMNARFTVQGIIAK